MNTVFNLTLINIIILLLSNVQYQIQQHPIS